MVFLLLREMEGSKKEEREEWGKVMPSLTDNWIIPPSYLTRNGALNRQGRRSWGAYLRSEVIPVDHWATH